MLDRTVSRLLLDRLARYPAVALVGPRQCGKTTLAGKIGGRYFDLEQAPDQLRLDLEWESICSDRALIVLDEAQEWPDLFPRLRGEIDRRRKVNGRFLLLGSVSPALMTSVSESLAGRLSVIELAPFSVDELGSDAQRRRHWLMGGYPDGGVLNGKGFPVWQRDYLDLLRQRDLPHWGLAATPQTTRRLLRMLAVLHGQEWNASQVGKSLGLSYHTVNSYVDYLEGAFLVRRLPAFHANIGKRLIKRPKLYWRDTGLLHGLLNIPDFDTLLAQPRVGASWEGYVIQQLITALENLGRAYECHYLRTSDQREIDLLVETERELWAIEVRLTARPGRNDLERLNRTADLVKADKRFLICRGREFQRDGRSFLSGLENMIAFISG